MVKPRPRFRIARGHVEDLWVGRAQAYPLYRQGWWWVCDAQASDGQPYDPEGPFLSKQAAYRHLLIMLSGRNHIRARGWDHQWGSDLRKRPTMRTVMKIRTTPAMRQAALREGRRGD